MSSKVELKFLLFNFTNSFYYMAMAKYTNFVLEFCQVV